MVVSCLAFASMWGAIRWASETLNPFIIVFYRNLLGSLLIMPMLVSGRGAMLKTARLGTHVRRATSGVVATFATFYAISHAPLATAMAISNTTPLIATLGAALFLGERLRWRRTTALVIGFVGMLVVVRPGQLPMTPGILAAMVAAIATAFSIVAIKELTRTESPRSVVAFSFLLMLPPSLLAALPFWRWPTVPELGILLLIASLATLGQSTLVRAFQHAEATAVLPYDFVRFGTVVLIGALAFGEPIDGYTLLGGSLILIVTIYLAHREAVAARVVKPASSPRDA